MDILAAAASQTSLSEASAAHLLSVLGGVKEIEPEAPSHESTEATDDVFAGHAVWKREEDGLLPREDHKFTIVSPPSDRTELGEDDCGRSQEDTTPRFVDSVAADYPGSVSERQSDL